MKPLALLVVAAFLALSGCVDPDPAPGRLVRLDVPPADRLVLGVDDLPEGFALGSRSRATGPWPGFVDGMVEQLHRPREAARNGDTVANAAWVFEAPEQAAAMFADGERELVGDANATRPAWGDEAVLVVIDQRDNLATALLLRKDVVVWMLQTSEGFPFPDDLAMEPLAQRLLGKLARGA